MLNNASYVAEQQEFRQSMVGVVEKHEIGQSLHFAFADGNPVLSRCGCEPDERITILSGGDLVLIRNLPKSIRDDYGLPDEILAKYNGNRLHPGFSIIHKGIESEYVIEFETFIGCEDYREVEIYDEEICE